MALTKNQKSIIKDLHNYVKKECIGFSDDDVFKNHVLGVKNYAVSLAKAYRADEFIVTIASYLHDLYYIQTHNHEIHEIKGSEIANKLLKKYHINENEIELISKCILHHRGSKESKRESIEEKIVACADAMDHINRFQHMFYRASQKWSYEEAVKWMKAKIERGWKKLELKKAKEMVKDKYAAAMLSFSADS